MINKIPFYNKDMQYCIVNENGFYRKEVDMEVHISSFKPGDLVEFLGSEDSTDLKIGGIYEVFKVNYYPTHGVCLNFNPSSPSFFVEKNFKIIKIR